MNFEHKPGALRGPCPLALGSTRVPAKRWTTRTDLIACLDRARQKMVEHPGTLDIAAVAELAGLSVFHFSRLFRETYGISPHRFIASERVSGASRLLRDTDLPISVIASRVGFSDPASFSRFFRQQTGETPTEHRRSGN